MTLKKAKAENLPEDTVCRTLPVDIARRAKLAVGVAALLSACLIYLSWRSDRINLCLWSGDAGLTPAVDFLRASLGSLDPGSFVKNSLPDGLYCAAYILIMDSVWERSRKALRIFMALLIPAVAIIHEILQYFNVVAGTFDPIDLICYSLPALIYLLILKNHHY